MDFEKVLEKEPILALNRVIAMQIEYINGVADCELREKEMRNLVGLLKIRIECW